MLGLANNRLTSLPKEIGQLKTVHELVLSNNRLTRLPKEIGQLRGLFTRLDDNRLTNLPKEIGQLQALKELDIRGNNLLYLPAKLKRFSKQLKEQNQTLQMKTILGQLRRRLKGMGPQRAPDFKTLLDRMLKFDRLKHEFIVLLIRMEKIHGKEMRSKLHACMYRVCKNEKSLRNRLNELQFGRKALIDPNIHPSLKIAALKEFEKMLLRGGYIK